VHYTHREIDDTINTLATKLETHSFDPDAIAVPIMTGAMFFAADLLREMGWKGRIKPVLASSYHGGRSSGKNKVIMAHMLGRRDPENEYTQGKQVLIIDDVLETGKTLERVIRVVRNCLAPKEIVAVALFDKSNEVRGYPTVSRYDTTPVKTFVGIRAPKDRFLIGFGMDDQGLERSNSFVICEKMS
tara:strand:+ start:5892 stop:6452 length:561 start_codon:yes stop_codon:yes gene_type:complete